MAYSYDEALQASLDYFDGDNMRATTFLQKYALKSLDGDEYYEKDPDDLHDRLADEFYRIEQQFDNPLSREKIRSELDGFGHIIPNGSPMAAIGNDIQLMSASNCFHPETEVWTQNRGKVRIDEVEIGDRVTTHTGNVHEVKQLHENDIGSRRLFEVKAYKTPSIKVTEDHGIYSISQEQLEWGEEPSFNPVSYLREGDYIAVPDKKDDGTFQTTIDVFDEFKTAAEKAERNYRIENEEEYLTTYTQYLGENNKEKENNPISDEWVVDERFAYFMGLWYGDGCVFSESKSKRRPQGITFTFGNHEENLVDFVSDYGSELLGIDPKIQRYKDSYIQITFHSRPLSLIFQNLFGRGYEEKYVSDFMFGWPEEMVKSFVTGLITSDGTVTKDGDVRFVMANPSFVKTVYHMLRDHNVICGYSEDASGVARIDFPNNHEIIEQVNKVYDDNRIKEAMSNNVSERHYRYIDGQLFVRIMNKTPINTDIENVYTVGVEGSHSYNVEGIICQNCFVAGNTADSYGGILSMDEDLAQIMKRRGGVGVDISHLRPKGENVSNAARSSTGAVSFMERLSDTTREVAQGGRRGALMITMHIRHPEAEDFIDIKSDETSVTGANVSLKVTDDFMRAVYEGENFVQRYPVNASPEEAQVTKEVNAKELWHKLIDTARDHAEPGVLFWDKMTSDTPADCYADLGYKTHSTNPCLTGDTEVWVADGRGSVSFETLAEEEKDVPVYTKLDDGSLGVKTMRNPRVTGENKDVYEVTLQNGHSFKATANHKLLSNENGYVAVEDLHEGESLHIGTSHYGSLSETFGIAEENNENYKLVSNSSQNTPKTEHRIIYEFHKGEISESEVIHHKDFDSKNNDPENLVAMDRDAHKELHRQDMMGKDNPYHKMNEEWQEKFASHPGKENGKFSGIENEEFRNCAIELADELDRRFTKWEWQSYAEENEIPKTLSDFRRCDEYSTITEFGKWAAEQAGVSDHNELHARTFKHISKMQSQGYDVRVLEDETVQVNRECENCGDEYWVQSGNREQSYCSLVCANEAKIENGVQDVAVSNMLDAKKGQAQEKRRKQLEVFTELAFEIGRDPLLKEWKNRCEEKGVSKRLRTKFGFDNYEDLKENAKTYNHRVKSVEYVGKETVYNGTVDDTHNFYFGNWNENGEKIFINSLNCGEVPLEIGGACRLTAMNLYSFVRNPFTSDAYFDFDKFRESVRIGQRIMDDIVQLDIEKIDEIIDKVKRDEEPQHVKYHELNLWQNIREHAVESRRTGLGLTALGDTFAGLGIRYGSDRSREIADKILRTQKVEAYRESVNLAKERGAFDFYDHSRERGNEFIERLREDAPDVVAEMEEHGRRNIAVLSIAPTGTVSQMAETTSGIENLFQPFYQRRRKVNPDDEEVEVDYVDKVGDAWQEFIVFHPRFKEYLEAQGYAEDTDFDDPDMERLEELRKQSPYDGATTSDVDWVSKVKLQGVIQKHIDHSISVTTNLPEDISVERVKDVYEESWRAGCKGCTIYRQGSRSGVLTDADESDEDGVVYHDAPERPDELECDIHQVRYAGEPWKILVGRLDEDPYEIFAIKTGGDTGIRIRFTDSEGNAVDEGVIVKRDSGVYDLEAHDGKTIVEDIADYAPDDHARVATRLLSLALRHGVKPEYIVNQLESANGSVVSFGRAVLKAMRKYLDVDPKMLVLSAAKTSSFIKRAASRADPVAIQNVHRKS